MTKNKELVYKLNIYLSPFLNPSFHYVSGNPLLTKKEITSLLLVVIENHISRWRVKKWGICSNVGGKYYIDIKNLQEIINKLEINQWRKRNE